MKPTHDSFAQIFQNVIIIKPQSGDSKDYGLQISARIKVLEVHFIQGLLVFERKHGLSLQWETKLFSLCDSYDNTSRQERFPYC